MHVNQIEFTNVMQQRYDQYSNNASITTDYNQQLTVLNNNNNTANNTMNDDVEVNNNTYDTYDHTKEEDLNSAADEAAIKNLTVEEVKNLLRLQLEFYFSRENLMHDKYLSSQMDGDNYVPIATISTFNMIKKYNPTTELICEAVEESPSLQLDSTRCKIRAACKRCVIILRDITSTLEEIVKLFDDERCPKFVNCEFAGNKSWYVTFKHEEDAKQAFQYLKEHVQTYQGKPIFARIKAHPIPRSSTSSAPIGVVNKVQSDKVLVNSAVLQQSTTPVPAQAYTPNAIDSSHQVIQQTLPTVPVQNPAALNTVPLTHAQTQYHQRIYSQQAAMYSLGQGYLQQPFYPAWINQNVMPNPNMQPIDQLTYQNNRSYHNVNLNATTMNQNSSPVNNGTNQQSVSPNSANANSSPAFQNQHTNRSGRPIHNKLQWSYRNNRNSVPNNKHISPRYNNNHYSNQSIQPQSNDLYATTASTSSSSNVANTTNTTTTITNTATVSDVKSNNNNNYEYKQQQQPQQQQQLNEYQLYRTNSYNNDIRRFSNNNNNPRQRNVHRHQNYYNNNATNNTTEVTNSLPVKHYPSSHRNSRYHQSNNVANGKDNTNSNGYYNNTNNNNVNERTNTNQNIDNSNSRSTTVTASNGTNSESNANNTSKTIFDYQPNSFPPLNNNMNNPLNEKYIIHDNNNNNKNTNVNTDNDSEALFVNINNNDDDANDTDNKTSSEIKPKATIITSIPTQHETKTFDNDKNDNKKPASSPSIKQQPQQQQPQQQQQQQQQETIDIKMNGLSINTSKKGSPSKVDDNNNSRKFTFAQIVQQNAEQQNKVVDENSNDINFLASPSTSLIQSTNSSGDEQEGKSENKNKLTNGKKVRQLVNGEKKPNDEANRNKPKKYRNTSTTSVNATTNNKPNASNATKRQNDNNNKFKPNINNNTAVVA